MRNAAILAALLLGQGCLGIFEGGQSGSEITSMGTCDEVSREVWTDLATPADDLDVSVDAIVATFGGAWSDGGGFDLDLAFGDAVAVVQLEDDGDPCPPAYAIPLVLHATLGTLVDAELTREHLVADTDELTLAAAASAWGGSVEAPDGGAPLHISGLLTPAGGDGELVWSTGDVLAGWSVAR